MLKEMKSILLIEQGEGSTLIRPASKGLVLGRIKKDPDKYALQELFNVSFGLPMVMILSDSVDENLQLYKRIETKGSTALAQVTNKEIVRKFRI
jgi:hypothetical protein